MSPAQQSYDEFVHAPRAAARILGHFFLRQWEIVGQMADRDLHKALVFAAIVNANVRHLDDGGENRGRYVRFDDPPPDEERRPVSTHALAQALGLPYETTRRNVNKLLAEGVCVRVPGRGLVAPGGYLAGPKNIGHMIQCLEALQQFLTSMRRAGFDLNALADKGGFPPAGVAVRMSQTAAD